MAESCVQKKNVHINIHNNVYVIWYLYNNNWDYFKQNLIVVEHATQNLILLFSFICLPLEDDGFPSLSTVLQL